MRITPTTQRPSGRSSRSAMSPSASASASASADELPDLEIDGYHIESTTRVALLPVELVEAPGGTDG